MRKLALSIVATLILILPALAWGAIAGSDHDLTGSGQKICSVCHIPHNALGDNLWASTPSGTFSGVQDLCYTCHDGSVTTIGTTTAFNTSLEQHQTLYHECSGGGSCHNVHTQSPNGTGKFMVVPLTNGSYCEFCHGVNAGGIAGGNHSIGRQHYSEYPTFTCNQCHAAHGATPQTTPPPGIPYPILLADNQPGAYDGAFCISCHNGIAPDEATLGSGGVASSDPFDYSEATNDGSGSKHPTISTDGSTPVGGCNKCHDVHDEDGVDTGYILMADNVDSAYCVSCHSAAGAPSVGANTHFTGIPADVNLNNGIFPALPWANQIDEDGNPGADYASATANMMVCESCHSVHRQGYAGAASYLLRDDNTNNEMCAVCHTTN